MAQTYTFSDGGRRLSVDSAPDEVYIVLRTGTNRQTALATVRKSLGAQLKASTEVGDRGFVLTLASASPDAAKRFRTGQSSPLEQLESAAPVFYDSSESPAARREGARRIMTAKLLVKMAGEADWSRLHQVTPDARAHSASLLKGWMLIEYADAYTALDAALALQKAGGWEFTPVFARHFEKRGAASGALQRPVNDPLFANQWDFAAGTPGISMNASWDVATGTGINVTVVDDGLETTHEDLTHAYATGTNYHRNFNDGTNDPTPANVGQNHGTNCAGIIGATGFNNVGIVGVAPEAMLMGLRILGGDLGDDGIGQAMSWQPEGLVTHVSSNSWGPADDGMAQGRMGALQAAGIEAASQYRGGLGTIFAVSAGNGRDSGDDASYDAFASSRYTIGVGAINRSGAQSSYSESGINVAIAAPGGEFKAPDVTWTTNNSGDAALASLKSKNDSVTAPVNYSDVFNGTSAAAPHVAGAAALLLQANPALGYRDVKEIFMRTATKDGLNGDAFLDNKSGFTFSHSFGAGLLNVSAALDLAAGWTNLGTLVSASATTANSKPIPDNSIDGANFTFDFSTAPAMRVEHVEFTVNVKHANRGDVGFILTSPSGMISIVNNRPPDTGADFVDYTFTSVRHWGEPSTGVWTVKVLDVVGNGITGSASNMSMKIYGTAK